MQQTESTAEPGSALSRAVATVRARARALVDGSGSRKDLDQALHEANAQKAIANAQREAAAEAKRAERQRQHEAELTRLESLKQEQVGIFSRAEEIGKAVAAALAQAHALKAEESALIDRSAVIASEVSELGTRLGQPSRAPALGWGAVARISAATLERTIGYEAGRELTQYCNSF